jgi:hypothetical protein
MLKLSSDSHKTYFARSVLKTQVLIKTFISDDNLIYFCQTLAFPLVNTCYLEKLAKLTDF